IGIDVLDRAGHVHLAAFGQAARHVDQGAARPGPDLAPLIHARREEADAGTRGTARALPLLDDGATAVAPGDRVVADQGAVRHAHFPAPDPEVELTRLRHPLAGIHAAAHAAQHALEPRLVAHGVEVRRFLEQ